MARRRNKKRANQGIVGLRRKVKINVDKLDGLETMMASDENKMAQENTIDDLKLKVQFTETTNLDTSLNNSVMYDMKSNKLSNGRIFKMKRNTTKGLKQVNKQQINNNENKDEVWIYPTEIDGETCIDIQCGTNDALMYLDRLCVGSQGACIKFVDSWLTPNEFQMVSGRETAKDWKRSIRHNGRSLKLLINKGLINIQRLSPKKLCSKSTRDTSVIKKDMAKPETQHNDGESTAGQDGVENVYLSSEKGDTDNFLLPETQRHGLVKRRGRKSRTTRGRRLTNHNERKTCTTELSVTDKAHKTPNTNSGFSDETKKAETGTSCSKNNSGEPADGNNTTPTDTRSEEERRLDEFVKSLRLTKINGQPTSHVKPSNALHALVGATTMVPSLNDVADVVELKVTTGTMKHEKNDVNVDGVDPEMPILQKEIDVIDDYDTATLALSVSVDAVNATVTPRSTVPSDRHQLEPKTQSVDSLKHVETFKATLASPSNGLKLTINREKVNYKMDFKDSDTKVDIKSVNKPENQSLDQEPDAATKVLMLHDALKSAREYKEQLQHSQPKSTTKSTTFVSKATVEPVLPDASVAMVIRDQTCKDDTNRKTREHNDGAKKGKTVGTETPYDATQRRPTGSTTPSVQLTSLEDTQRHSAKSFKEFMSDMESVSGSLPTNIDKKDIAASALRELQLKYDMLRLLKTQGQLCMSSPHQSSLLYPMITQQLMLAMAQQLQSTYNITDIPVPVLNGVPSVINHKHHNKRPVSRTNGMPNSKQKSSPSNDKGGKLKNSTTTVEAQNNDIGQLLKAHSMHGSHAEKRKHVEVDNDGAIDLSMKKRQTSVNTYKSISVLNIDGPLDFSLKRSHSSTAPTSSCASYNSHSICSSSTNGTNRKPYTHSNATTYHTPVTSIITPYRNHTNLVMSSSGQCTCSSGFSEMASWSVEQVCSLLTSVQGCAPYTKTFREQGISGRLLPYLTSQHLTRTLGMTTSHASSLMNAVGRRLRDQKAFKCSTCQTLKPRVTIETLS